MTPARAQVLITISGLPWNIKPCYGILSDAVPLCGTHRRGYLGLMGTLATAGFLLLAALPPAEGTATAALFPLGFFVLGFFAALGGLMGFSAVATPKWPKLRST